LFVVIIANFRLKQKVVSNNIMDPSLSHSWTYFVEEAGYKEFLAEKIDIVQEVSHWSAVLCWLCAIRVQKSTYLSHNAVNMADRKTN
jgi:hypothetical protein